MTPIATLSQQIPAIGRYVMACIRLKMDEYTNKFSIFKERWLTDKTKPAACFSQGPPVLTIGGAPSLHGTPLSWGPGYMIKPECACTSEADN